MGDGGQDHHYKKTKKTSLLNIGVMDCHLTVYLKLPVTIRCCLLFSARIAAKSAKYINSYFFKCKQLSQLRHL